MRQDYHSKANNMITVTNNTISALGVQEKYIRKEHYNSIKVWWARRPIMAMRSLILNELRRTNQVNDFDDDLIYRLNPKNEIFQNFSVKNNTRKIKLLDVFSGGGAIPFESARLGLDTYCAELNPVASLLHETIFNSLHIEKYPNLLKKTAYDIIDMAEQRLKPLFSVEGTTPYVIYWGRTAQCKSCGEHLSLGRLKYLAKKKNKTISLIRDQGDYVLSSEHDVDQTKLTRSKKGFICSHCDTSHSFADIKSFATTNHLGNEPLAICYHKGGKKSYMPVTPKIKKELLGKKNLIDSLLAELGGLIPYGEVAAKSGVINPTLYDLKSHKDFFNSRQLVVLLVVIDEIIKSWPVLNKTYGFDVAKQVILGLTSLIEFLVDWNSKSTMWIPQNEQTGRSLVGPGVGMKWDYIEINPFYKTGSNLRSKIDRVVETFSKIKINNNVHIITGSSRNLPIDDNTIDMVLTDPPYFDSVDYTALSEFFRPWFEKIINATFDENMSLKNDTNEEAIVALSKESKKIQTAEYYQKIMSGVLSEVHRVLKDKGACLFLYSHKTLEGWEVIAEAFKNAGFQIDHIDALNMERKARPRAMSYQALNGVVVFRLVKSGGRIKNLNDPANIQLLLKSGELDENNLPIYLAASACSHFLNHPSKSFRESYGQIVAEYKKSRIETSNISDPLTRLYLKMFCQSDNETSDPISLEKLSNKNLISANGRLKTIFEISTDEIAKEEVLFLELIALFKDNKFNSKVRILIDESFKELAIQFCSIIGGHNLNSVKKRTSLEEQKVARLILSKIC